MKTLHVELGDRRYPIYIGASLLDQAELLTSHIHGHQVMLVSNETVAPLYLQRVIDNLKDFEVHQVILPDGEQYKTLDITNRIFTALLETRCDRSVTVVALGGGVIGDITGFAAACYQRGVAFIQIPTTLLAQVDSSVGGKTGVNHALGKNMIGAFYQPQCVIADTDTLNTLDDRQLAAGIAEVIKYGLIRDKTFYDWLQRHVADLSARDGDALSHAIEVSCQNKADVVAADELESGQRALLNLGHTFGHAIETGTGYGVWLHGEAVGAGMAMAADLSLREGWISIAQQTEIIELIKSAKLPVTPPLEMDAQRFHELMAVDKKVLRGVLRLVLLKDIGEAVVSSDFDPDNLDATLREYGR